MDSNNLALALQITHDLLQAAMQTMQKIGAAHAAGRNLSDDELAEFVSADDVAKKNLELAIAARDNDPAGTSPL